MWRAPAPRRQAMTTLAKLIRRLGRQWLTLATGLAAALPVIVSTARALAAGWMPTVDQSFIAIRSYDVLTAQMPLVGQFSYATFVTGHPTYSLGPMLYWLLALPAHIRDPGAMALTMGVVNAACVVASVALARRRGGPALMFAAAIAIVALSRSFAPETLHDTWNPSAGLFPLLLLCFLSWSAACGEFRLLPVLVLVASFEGQVQLAFLAPAIGLLVVAAVGLAITRAQRRESDAAARLASRRSLRRWALAVLLVGFVCWSAPLYDQFERSGNLVHVVQSATASTPTLGLRVGWRSVVRAVGIPPRWLRVARAPFDDRTADGRGAVSTASSVFALLVLLALVAGVFAGWRQGRVALAAAAAIGLVLCVTLALAAAHTPKQSRLAAVLSYTLWSGSVAGMWVWLTLGWIGCTLAVGDRLRRLLRPVRAPALAAAVGLGAVAACGSVVAIAARADQHVAEYRPRRALMHELDRAIPSGRTVRIEQSLVRARVSAGPTIAYALRRRGIRVLEAPQIRLGSYYEYRGQRYDYLLYADDRPGFVMAGATALIRVPWFGRTITISVVPSSGGVTRR